MTTTRRTLSAARVLRWVACAGHLDHADARDMAGWDHGGGFSLDASVRIDGADRAGGPDGAGLADRADQSTMARVARLLSGP